MSEINRSPAGVLFLLFSVAYLILAMNLPVWIRPGPHDDALYWGLAYQIVKGNWLGEYSQMTLAKGPGFPLFLATNAVLGIPVTLLIALFYLFACRLIASVLSELGLNKYLVLTLFVVILFHPALFPTRIIRDNIYPALSLIVISGVIRLTFAPLQKNQSMLSAVPYGIAFGLFWITREEGIWIVPGLLLLLFLKVLQSKKQNLLIQSLSCRFGCFLVIATMFVSSIALINYHKYGKFEVVDFKGKAYSKAFKSLNSVDVGPDLPYLPVSFSKRQEIYRISPTFSQLEDYFEVKGKGWTGHGCKHYPWTCGDYAGGWFAWALRDAVASKGHYESPQRAAEFYNKITKEIQTACDIGAIKCRTNPIPLMPNFPITQLKQIPGKVVDALTLATVQRRVLAIGHASTVPLPRLQEIRLFLGNPRTTPAVSEQKSELRGWFYSADGDWIVLNCLMNGKKIKRHVDRIISPDIAEYVEDPQATFQRFFISVSSNEDCNISTISSSSVSIPINSLSKEKPRLKIGENGTLHVNVLKSSNQSMQDWKKDLPLELKNLLANVYKLVIPVLALLGALAYLIYCILIWSKRASVTDMFMVSTMMWFLFLSRIILLILVDISSFPAIMSYVYMSAVLPIFCLAAILSIQSLFSNTMERRNHMQ